MKIAHAGDPFRVWEKDEDEDRDAVTIHAFDPEDAAIEWASQDDWHSAEYDIVSGRATPTIHVRDKGGTVTTWTVMGESLPHYTATPEPEV